MRTQVEQSIRTVFESDSHKIAGFLRDISHAGIGIESKQTQGEGGKVQGLYIFSYLLKF